MRRKVLAEKTSIEKKSGCLVEYSVVVGYTIQ